jgi:hypothetical protein
MKSMWRDPVLRMARILGEHRPVEWRIDHLSPITPHYEQLLRVADKTLWSGVLNKPLGRWFDVPGATNMPATGVDLLHTNELEESRLFYRGKTWLEQP